MNKKELLQEISDIVERIRRGMQKQLGYDFPALESGLTRAQSEQAIEQLIADQVSEVLDEIWEKAKWSTPEANEPEYFTKGAIKQIRKEWNGE